MCGIGERWLGGSSYSRVLLKWLLLNQIVGFNEGNVSFVRWDDDVGTLLFFVFLTKLMFWKSWDVVVLWLYHVVPLQQRAVRRKPACGRDIDRVFPKKILRWAPSPFSFGVFTRNLLLFLGDRWRIERTNTVIDPSPSNWNRLVGFVTRGCLDGLA